MAAVLVLGTAKTAAAAPAEPMTWPDSPPPPAPQPAAPRYVPPPTSEREQIRNALRGDSEIGYRYRQGRGMIVGGAVSLGASGAFLLTAGVFSLIAGAKREPYDSSDFDPEDDGSSERSLAIGLAVTAGMLVAVGVPLVAVGAVRRGHAIEDARRRVTLGSGPRGFGLRF